MTSLTEGVPFSRAPAGVIGTMRKTIDKEWKMGNVVVGVYVNAMIFIRALLIDENIDINQFKTLEFKTVRQFGRGQTDDDDNDVSGFVAVSDVGAATLFNDIGTARTWANNPKHVNVETAPSLTYVTSGKSMVTLLKIEL